MIEVREAPVPVRGWNEERNRSRVENLSLLRQVGWSCDLKYAREQIATVGRKTRLMLLLNNGQTVIVRAKK